MPVHDCRTTMERTFRSVFEQTMPAGQIEIIAVDDGSADGSGEELDRLAAGRSGFTVVHQPPSGGPGRPRNVGIERATGEYVFFLDADDYLGPEALERCCAMADRNASDVVVPKYVGVGRKVNPYLFRKTVESTTIYDEVPNLYGSITALKLYRRSLLEQHRIRFPEKVLSGEDQAFAVRAYFEAKVVSVLADYDCYYWVDRQDGSSALQKGGAPAADYFPEIERLMAFVADRTEPGPVRERLMRRHFSVEVFSRFDPRYQAFSPEERRATRDGARRLLELWGTPEIMAQLTPYMRVLGHALRAGLDDLVDEVALAQAEDRAPVVVEDDAAFVAYPGFRDEALGIPDEVFEARGRLPVQRALTGMEWRDGRLLVRARAIVAKAGEGGRKQELVLRRRDGGEQHRVPFRPERPGDVPADEFVAEIDFTDAPPVPGRWDAQVVIAVEDVTQEGRLVAAEGVEPPEPRIAAVRDGRPLVKPYLTKGVGALALHVGGRKTETAPATPAEVTSGTSGTLRIGSTLAAALPSGDGAPTKVRVLLRHRGSGEVRATAATVEPVPGGLDVSAEVDLRGARWGTWDASYEVTVGAASGEFRVPFAAGDGEAPGALRGPRPFSGSGGDLSVKVGNSVISRLRRVLPGRSQ
ncbi:glycosyltransferase family 2 protein [Actinomadura vinacea]|uniref:glycosyltransferase family 2 protein n=1 Tax=Actinomadura vinacea TaxID=115336 RepID=UPI003CD067C4